MKEFLSFDTYDITPKMYLGEMDALHEWSQVGHPEKVFVHTDSYKNICTKNILFLVGRRGTGKTAIINMLDYEVNKSINTTYSHSLIINRIDEYNPLKMLIRNDSIDLEKNDLISDFKDKWRWIITVSSMYTILKDDRISTSEKKEIHNYLSQKEIIFQKGQAFLPFKYIINSILQDIRKNSSQNLGVTLTSVNQELYCTEYYNAECELINILTTRNLNSLILIDSIESYQLNDYVSEAAILGLIEALLDLYNDKSKHIYAKLALPSEIIPHLKTRNWGKISDKLNFIRWSYKDLVIFLAKRFAMVSDNSLINSEILKFDLYSYSRSFLYTKFPEKINSYTEMEIDTLAYIISHTQKKPRQVMYLVNVILTLAEKNNISFDSLTENCVKIGIHINLETLVKESLEVYDQIYPNAISIVRKILTSSNVIFNYGALDSKVASANSILKTSTISLTKEDVKDLLIHSGTIGITSSTHIVNSNKAFKLSNFEYQMKESLVANNNTEIVIHPMFFQDLHVEKNNNIYIYPMPTDEEELNTLGLSSTTR